MPNRFTSRSTVAQLREALEGLDLDSRGKKDTLLKRLNGALRRSESPSMRETDAESSSPEQTTTNRHSQPLDAFLCFDVEATCVADKQIDWPNEIIEFPVVLLHWVPDDGLEDDAQEAEPDHAATGNQGSSTSESPAIVAAPLTQSISAESSASNVATDSNTDTVALERSAKNSPLARREPSERMDDTDKLQDSIDRDDTGSELEVEALMVEDEEAEQPVYQGKKKLVIKDQFHSYVRPVWQPKLSTFCSGLTGISQETVNSAPIFPDMVKEFEAWLNKHGLLVDGKLREGACWCTDGPWDLRDFLPKQLHITPLKPDPYPAYFKGPILNVKSCVNFVLCSLWYIAELEKSAAMEAKYRATLETTRHKAEESRRQAGDPSVENGATAMSRPPPLESPVQKRLRNLPRLCSTGSWALSIKGIKMPNFFLTITGQLKALGLGEFQGQQHSGIDDTLNIARIVMELARRDVLLDINEKPFQPRKFNWMGKPGQVFWNRKTLVE